MSGTTQSIQKDITSSTPVDNTPKLLKNLDFTDIYVNESGMIFMKGLILPEYLINGGVSNDDLKNVPDDYMEETSVLVKKALAQNEIETRASFPLEFGGMSFRITKINTIKNKWITMRKLLHPVPRIQSFKGIPRPVIRAMAHLGAKGSSGIILFTGKTGSGKTTLACSLLQGYLVTGGDVAVTLDRPAELKLDGGYGPNNKGWCFQTEVLSNGYAKAVENVMRYTPRIILFGEIRGPEEARQALRLGNTGHLVISTMHSSSGIDAINRFIELASEGDDIKQASTALSRALLAVFNQKMNITHAGKIFDLTSLFIPPDDTRIKGMIANNTTNQLVTDIDRQKILIDNGEDPSISVERYRALRESKNR